MQEAFSIMLVQIVLLISARHFKNNILVSASLMKSFFQVFWDNLFNAHLQLNLNATLLKQGSTVNNKGFGEAKFQS